MKTIVFAATKGGVGKTTLAFNFAIEAAKHGTVFYCDMDPQGSLMKFARIRDDTNPMLLKNVKSVARAVSDLARTRHARNYLVVDTPGSFMDIIRDAAIAADCVVVPMQPSPVDVVAQEDVVEMLNRMGKLHLALPVLSRVKAGARISDIEKRTMEMFPVPYLKVGDRVAYQRALIKGKSGPEIDDSCAAEIAALWKSVQQVAGEV